MRPWMTALQRNTAYWLSAVTKKVVGASMGLSNADHFKRLKIMQDADAIVADCAGLIGAHGIAPARAREAVVKAMLGEQPLPLRGSDNSAAPTG